MGACRPVEEASLCVEVASLLVEEGSLRVEEWLGEGARLRGAAALAICPARGGPDVAEAAPLALLIRLASLTILQCPEWFPARTQLFFLGQPAQPLQ